MTKSAGVHHLLALLLAATAAWSVDAFHSLASERKSIESTYELTKYLEYQLKEIKDVYLTYLGPPFNQKDFSPPRPNITALSQASAATQLEQWHDLENQARLAQNQRAYSILLAAVRELARSTFCPSLKTSLLHFCTGLDGLLGSISALMNSTLGYSSSSQSNAGSTGGGLQASNGADRAHHPAPLMSHNLYRSRAGSRGEPGQRRNQRRSGIKGIRKERRDDVRADLMEKQRGRDWGRGQERGLGGKSGRLREKGKTERRREKRAGEERWGADVEDVEVPGFESWGRGRKLLSVEKEEEKQPSVKVEVSYWEKERTRNQRESPGKSQFSLLMNYNHQDTLRKEDGFVSERSAKEERRPMDVDAISSFFHHQQQQQQQQQQRSPRSIFSPTPQPPLSTLSLLYQYEDHTLLPQAVPISLHRGTSLLSPPMSHLFAPSPPTSSPSSFLSMEPTMNNFARKVEGFWILRELQSWLWRSAKDFNRLKRRLRG